MINGFIRRKCIHLGNTLTISSTGHALIDSAITDLNVDTNNLLSNCPLVSLRHCRLYFSRSV